eukprot:SAG22_NODE_5998_length_918_cov_1.413919_1_plen_103_part_10
MLLRASLRAEPQPLDFAPQLCAPGVQMRGLVNWYSYQLSLAKSNYTNKCEICRTFPSGPASGDDDGRRAGRRPAPAARHAVRPAGAGQRGRGGLHAGGLHGDG